MMEQLQDSPSSDSESELSMPSAVSSSSSDSVSSISTNASPSSYSETSLSMLSPIKKTVHQSPTCFFDPSTCQYQNFSIPEKIVYYIAKNVTNAETYQKLIESCKYFFNVNPVIVVSELKSDAFASSDDHTWSVYNDERTYFEFKNPQTLNFKIWLTQKFLTFYLSASQMIPKIYKNDATFVYLGKEQDITWEEFLFFAGNAETLHMSNDTIKYEEGKAVTLERIVKSVPNLKFLQYASNADGSDITSNTFNKLIEMEHFKNISYLYLFFVPEELNVDTMFNYILENKHIQIYLRYRSQVSDAYKERIREYSNLLKNENGCKSYVECHEIYGVDDDVASISSFEESESSEDNDSDVFSDSCDDDDNVDLLFPWNNEDEEGWELPWDI